MKLRSFLSWVMRTGTRSPKTFWLLNVIFIAIPIVLEAKGDGHWFAWVFCCGICWPALWVATYVNWNKRPPR